MDSHDDAMAQSEGDINRSARRAAWAGRHIDGATQALLDRDAAVFLHQSLSTPCLNVIDACDGATLTDRQGRDILDFHGNGLHQVGYGNGSVIEAIKAQLDTLPFCPRRYTNEPAIELAEKLAELAPGNLCKVLFAPGGAEAMGIALKLARLKTGRFKTISMWDAFHGASLDMASIGGEALFRKDIGPLLPGTEHVPPPDPAHCPFKCGKTCDARCADYVEYVLEKEGDVAAVIAETVRSTPYIPTREYWRRVRAACDKHGALLILDEIPTALGRTGYFFACEAYDIVPDILVIGKGLGGGVMPLAALIAGEALDIAGNRALGHYTHEKNPVACAAALATLNYIEAQDLPGRAKELGDYFVRGLRELQEEFSLVSDVRGAGLLLGVELTHEDGRRATDEAEEILYHALSNGLSFKITMGNILTLCPPLTVTEAELDRALRILAEALRTLDHQDSSPPLP